MAVITVACSEEGENDRPGLYTADEMIETFAGDTALVSGTVSNYVGINSIDIQCDAWGISHTIDLAKHHPKVFNYSYQMVVPTDATFPQELLVVVKDKNGLENRKAITLKFLPDMVAPTVSGAPSEQVSIDFDPDTQSAVWNIDMSLSDDRALSSIRLQIPSLYIDETTQIEGRSYDYQKSIEITQVGTYDAYITVTDASGNTNDISTQIISMLAEDEDPVSDYDGLYVVDAAEDEADYIDGYYRYMDRMGEYQYQGKFYAATDNAQMLFVPSKSMTSDVIGASPYTQSKILNKRGYVVPVVIEKKGYYGVWVDLQAHTCSVWSLDIDASTTCADPLWMSGTGFSFGDWAASDQMTKVGTYRYQVETSIDGSYTGDRQYYFYTDGWARVFRADNDGKWWFESASGTCIIFKTNYDGAVVVTFDTAAPWATIKKKK